MNKVVLSWKEGWRDGEMGTADITLGEVLIAWQRNPEFICFH